ncbi:YkvA family protein [Aneurinibacillus sp. REN35]|uniref:YkvA family protein n=1 Tax=Aneurinibacillus sp. REN35 TaxID=3237286 RepID=UPI003526E47A
MRKFINRLRFILNVRRFIPFLGAFFTSREVPIKKKVVSVLLLAGYIVFPFDLIPDFLTFFGIVDDLAVLTFVLQRIVRMSPQHLKDKYGALE